MDRPNPFRGLPEAELDSFLDAVADNRDDDTPRLILADWLEEHNPEAADFSEFIRLSCKLAALELNADKAEKDVRANIRGRVHAIFRKYVPQGLHHYYSRRGFLHGVGAPLRLDQRSLNSFHRYWLVGLHAEVPCLHPNGLQQLEKLRESRYGRFSGLTMYVPHSTHDHEQLEAAVIAALDRASGLPRLRLFRMGGQVGFRGGCLSTAVVQKVLDSGARLRHLKLGLSRQDDWFRVLAHPNLRDVVGIDVQRYAWGMPRNPPGEDFFQSLLRESYLPPDVKHHVVHTITGSWFNTYAGGFVRRDYFLRPDAYDAAFRDAGSRERYLAIVRSPSFSGSALAALLTERGVFHKLFPKREYLPNA